MKSIHVKLNEALEALDKAGKRKQYNEKVQAPMTAETRLNLAESILGDKITKESANPLKLEDIEESKRDYAVLFGTEPRPKATNKESAAAPIVKHNGRADNFNENDPLRRAEGRPVQVTETHTPKDICAKGDKVMFDGLLKLGKITEAEHRKLTGTKPAGYENLNEKQRKDFDFARLVGINEADAFKLARMTDNNFKEISRR